MARHTRGRKVTKPYPHPHPYWLVRRTLFRESSPRPIRRLLTSKRQAVDQEHIRIIEAARLQPYIIRSNQRAPIERDRVSFPD